MARISIFVLLATLGFVLLAGEAKAQTTQWSGTMFVEGTELGSPDSTNHLLLTGLNLDVRPPMKKKLQAQFTGRIEYANLDGQSKWNNLFSPLGNMSFDLLGTGYSFSFQHSDVTTITPFTTVGSISTTPTSSPTRLSNPGGLQEIRTSRATLNINLPDRPTLIASYSTTKTITKAGDTTSGILTLFSDYKYKWFRFRGGYDGSQRDSSRRELGQSSGGSSSIIFGAGGTYEILPLTLLTFDFSGNRYSSEIGAGNSTTTLAKDLHVAAQTQPASWLDFTGTISRNTTDTQASLSAIPSTLMRNVDLTANVTPMYGLRFSTSVGKRTFNDVATLRDISYSTYLASFNRPLRDKMLVGVTANHTNESDPRQGSNSRDSVGLNSTLDLTPRVSARLNFNVTRNDTPSFVDTKLYGASGTLAELVLYDDRPAGFTFFDVVHSDLYTKNSPAPGDWSAPVHLLIITQQYSATSTLQMNMSLTDKAGLVFFYTATSASPKLDLTNIVNQSLSFSLNYQPNRRTYYGLSGVASIPQGGGRSYSGTSTMSYRLFRGHQLNMSYGIRLFDGKLSDYSSGTLRLVLRKRTNVDIIYAITQIMRVDQSDFVKIRLSRACFINSASA